VCEGNVRKYDKVQVLGNVDKKSELLRDKIKNTLNSEYFVSFFLPAKALNTD
jgi:hypothetical protein